MQLRDLLLVFAFLSYDSEKEKEQEREHQESLLRGEYELGESENPLILAMEAEFEHEEELRKQGYNI